MPRKTVEYEIRTIDCYGDVLDVVDRFPGTAKGLADATVRMRTVLEDSGDEGAVAAVLEKCTRTPLDPCGQNCDLDYGEPLAWCGDEEALEEGGWIPS